MDIVTNQWDWKDTHTLWWNFLQSHLEKAVGGVMVIQRGSEEVETLARATTLFYMLFCKVCRYQKL